MKKRVLCILISLFIVALVGCSSKNKQVTSSNEKNTQTEQQDKNTQAETQNNSTQTETQDNNTQTEQQVKNTQTEQQGKNTQIESQGKTVSKTPIATSSNIYKNEKLGFSITFPDSWKGKYTIEEKDNGIWVNYKAKVNIQNQGSGSLFGILKDTTDLEDQLDTVNGTTKFFNAKGIKYIIGGSTDMTFESNHPEFQTFFKMYQERANVIKTLKSL